MKEKLDLSLFLELKSFGGEEDSRQGTHNQRQFSGKYSLIVLADQVASVLHHPPRFLPLSPCLGSECVSRIPLTAVCPKQQQRIGLEAAKSKIKELAERCLVRAQFLSHKQLSSHVLRWPRQSGYLHRSLLIRTLIPSMKTPHSWPKVPTPPHPPTGDQGFHTWIWEGNKYPVQHSSPLRSFLFSAYLSSPVPPFCVRHPSVKCKEKPQEFSQILMVLFLL